MLQVAPTSSSAAHSMSAKGSTALARQQPDVGQRRLLLGQRRVRGQCQARRLTTASAAQQTNNASNSQGVSAAVGVDRRQLLLGAASLAAAGGVGAWQAQPTLAEGEFTTYSDAEGFQISVPADWVFGEGGLEGNNSFSGASGVRRAIGWYKDNDPGTNVVVVLTTIAADYTSMGSFGTAYDFGSNMVGSMDRSYLLRSPTIKPQEVQVAKLVDAKEVGSGGPKTYFVEYSIVRPGGDARRLYSVATLGFNGRYNRLYTITAQCAEGAAATDGKLLEQVVKSFKPPANLVTFGR